MPYRTLIAQIDFMFGKIRAPKRVPSGLYKVSCFHAPLARAAAVYLTVPVVRVFLKEQMAESDIDIPPMSYSRDYHLTLPS